MFRKKENQLLEKAEREELSQNPWLLLWRRLRRRRLARWSLRVLWALVFVAIFGDFIANERPLYCEIEGQTYFPVFRQYFVDAGWSNWPAEFFQDEWREHEYDAVVFPPIPYSASTTDMANSNFKSPGSKQNIKSVRWRHWLGTDLLGHDVAAGMVAGCRIALFIALLSMSVATFIGLLLGSLAGFFGNRGIQISYGGILLGLLALLSGWFYGFQARGRAWSVAIEDGNIAWEFTKGIFVLVLFLGIAKIVSHWFKMIPFFRKQVSLPMDMLVMRFIEILNSIPGLLLLIAVVGILQSSSIFVVMVIIGCIRWTGIARFLRAELLRIRNLGYVESARAMGFSEWRILWKHALPNSLSPVLISISFGLAATVLLESTLSFLGLGIGLDNITWGTMLSEARRHPSAWWLAIFPGLAIFITVTIFNLIGEGLTDALEE